ncbi:uncharacterized protein [Asterias amurensis]|uniref:uncharacterized protein isoform X2 n=1 Tax=Asterias amurensis TaxID=7602 RepID=UPI003AB4C5B1
MTHNQEFIVKIQPLTSGVEVGRQVEAQPSVDGQFLVPRGNLVRLNMPQVEVNNQTAEDVASSDLKYYGVPPRKRQTMTVSDTPSSSSEGDSSLVTAVSQVQLLERIASLEEELTRTKWEVTQLRELNSHLQQGIPHVIRRTFREELNTCTCKTHSGGLNTPSKQGSSHKQRGGHREGKQKRHKNHSSKATPGTVTKKMLMKWFGRDTLARSTLTGKGGKSKTLTKAQLDPSIVKTIVAKVTERFGVSECVVRSVISQKCKEEMVIRRRRLTLDMQMSGADKVA